jgi:hypothetical protein
VQKRLVLIGVGNAGLAINALATGYDTKYGTTRSFEKVDHLSAIGLIPIVYDAIVSAQTVSSSNFDSKHEEKVDAKSSPEVDLADANVEALADAAIASHVVVTCPPSPDDARLARAVRGAEKVVYISSTGVYGGVSGVIDEETPVDRDSSATAPRLAAEEIWRSIGAVVLRAPALYGPDYGMHISLHSGKYKLPGDGSRYSSRIHLDDLANLTLLALEFAAAGSTYVVGDKTPAPQLEVVEWLCAQLGLSLPDSIPLEDAHITQRGNRQIRADKVLRDLNAVLIYPTYKDGFSQCIRECKSFGLR